MIHSLFLLSALLVELSTSSLLLTATMFDVSLSGVFMVHVFVSNNNILSVILDI